MRRLLISAVFSLLVSGAYAQIGLYRNDMSIGVNGGYVLSNVGFNPKVNQTYHGGFTGGVSFRYVCEKYFSTICALQAEVNFAQIGWKEEILDANDAPVINPVTGVAEQYSRTMNYVQIPIFAHLGWGREDKGFQFFFQEDGRMPDSLPDATPHALLSGSTHTHSGCLWAYRSAPPVPSGRKSASAATDSYPYGRVLLRPQPALPVPVRFPVLREWHTS